MQLANTPPLQSTTPGLHPVSFHRWRSRARKHTSDSAYYSDYGPRKDERLSQPGWLVTYRNKVLPPGVELRHVTHPSTNRAWRRVTSLIRPTPLPLRHAARVFRIFPTLQWSITWGLWSHVAQHCAVNEDHHYAVAAAILKHPPIQNF